MTKHIRRNHTGHRLGEHHPKARLSDDEVFKMRRMSDLGASIPAIAKAFECSYLTAYDIIKYKTRY